MKNVHPDKEEPVTEKVMDSVKMRPLKVDRLTDLINPLALELIALGFGVREALPWTIIERGEDGLLKRIPSLNSHIREHWSPLCRQLRSTPQGEALCQSCDDWHALYALDKADHVDWYSCHAGLYDIALPIKVAGRRLGVFFGGQKRLSGKDTDAKELLSALDKTYQNIPMYYKNNQVVTETPDNASNSWPPDKEQLWALYEKTTPSQPEGLVALKIQIEKILENIVEVAELRYQFQDQNLKEQFLQWCSTYFITEFVRSTSSIPLIVSTIFKKLNNFVGLERTCLLCTAAPLDWIDSNSEKVSAQANDLFTLRAYFDKFFIEIHSKEEKTRVIRPEGERNKVYQIITKTLHAFPAIDKNNNYVIFVRQVHLAGHQPAYLIGFNDPTHESSKYLSVDAKTTFIELFVNRIQSLLELALEHARLEEFQASSIHRFRSPLQWAFDSLQGMKNSVPRSMLHPHNKEDGVISENVCIQDVNTHLSSLADHLSLMSRITKNICHAAGLAQQEVGLNSRQFVLSALVKNIVQSFGGPASNRGIQVIYRTDCIEPVEIVADEEKIATVIENLIDNAVKYSHAKRDVIVTITNLPEKLSWGIDVSDYGIGVANDEYELVFDKYFRSIAARDTRRTITGSGIGLAVVRAFVQAHGGEVSVTSKKRGKLESSSLDTSENWEGFKTVFSIILPKGQIQ